MKLNTIHHVAIIVSDYERAKEFYVGKLGFQVLRENYQARRGSYKLDLKAGDQELEVFYMPGAPKRVTNPEACGLRHLCFRVESVEEARPGAGGAGNRSHAYPPGRLHRGKAVFLF